MLACRLGALAVEGSSKPVAVGVGTVGLDEGAP